MFLEASPLSKLSKFSLESQVLEEERKSLAKPYSSSFLCRCLPKLVLSLSAQGHASLSRKASSTRTTTFLADGTVDTISAGVKNGVLLRACLQAASRGCGKVLPRAQGEIKCLSADGSA